MINVSVEDHTLKDTLVLPSIETSGELLGDDSLLIRKASCLFRFETHDIEVLVLLRLGLNKLIQQFVHVLLLLKYLRGFWWFLVIDLVKHCVPLHAHAKDEF